MNTHAPAAFTRMMTSLAAASAIVLASAVLPVTHQTFVGVALADENGGGQGKMQKGNPGTGGDKGRGPGTIGGTGKGQGGPDETSEGKGPRAGQSGQTGDKGGKPAWAQEGIPEIELGRLNVARAPGRLLDQQLDEALKAAESMDLTIYTLPISDDDSNNTNDVVSLLKTSYDTVVRIDSPLQNIALYKELLEDGYSALPTTTSSVLDLAALLLGSASDKTLAVTTDTVIAMNVILGLVVSDAATSAEAVEKYLDSLPGVDPSIDAISYIATEAEKVRDAILTGHGV